MHQHLRSISGGLVLLCGLQFPPNSGLAHLTNHELVLVLCVIPNEPTIPFDHGAQADEFGSCHEDF